MQLTEVVAATSRNDPLGTVQNVTAARSAAHKGVVSSQDVTALSKHLDWPNGSTGLALDNLDARPFRVPHPTLRPLIENWMHLDFIVQSGDVGTDCRALQVELGWAIATEGIVRVADPAQLPEIQARVAEVRTMLGERGCAERPRDYSGISESTFRQQNTRSGNESPFRKQPLDYRMSTRLEKSACVL